MVPLEFCIPTNQPAERVQEVLEKRVESEKELVPIAADCRWNSNTLHVNSAFGCGTLTILHNEVRVRIELSSLGLAARSKIVEKITEQIHDICCTLR